ncbi:MAG: hypothetical protein QMD08_04870 [Actinomycetota bacterium]|nr:hypothetical protein [Actinomycetota bacterium]
MVAQRKFRCYDCGHEFQVPYGTGVPGARMTCPKCGSSNVHRAEGDRGYTRARGGSFGAGRGPSVLGRGRGGGGRGPRRI